MTTNQVTTYLKYANLQMAAEAFLDSPDSYEKQLTTGNKRSSKFTETQAKEFKDDWTVVEHISNTATGFSGTLFRCLRDDETRGLKDGELVLSMRSTEFLDDGTRDNQATNTMELRPFGWAFGQITDMMSWFNNLESTGKIPFGEKVAVTGYSLGANIAVALNHLMVEQGRGGRISATYTFNGAGVGKVNSGHTLTEALNVFDTARNSGNADYFKDPVALNLYNDVRASFSVPNPTALEIGKAAGKVTDAMVVAAQLKPTAETAARLKELEFLQQGITRIASV
ncbi:MAG: hypothetical protein ACOVOD_01760, partial [Rhodoferax sp.]